MNSKIINIDFGQFNFLDERTVVATAHEGENIDAKKVHDGIALIEQTLPGNYALILNRKNDYSIVPVEVYKYFASLERLKAIAIVHYSNREFLPDNMEQRIFGRTIQKFKTVDDAHDWLNSSFAN